MNLFPNPSFNGGFLSPNSSKPIAGICTNTAYKRPLIQAKVSSTSGVLTPGAAVNVTNKVNAAANSVNAGVSLAPTTLECSLNTTGSAQGFAVMSPNAVLVEGDTFPQYVKNQVIHVALLGSGAEMYLPCDATLIGATNPIYWDGEKLVSAATAPTNGFAIVNITVLSQVVDGVVASVNTQTGAVTTKASSVVKVRI